MSKLKKVDARVKSQKVPLPIIIPAHEYLVTDGTSRIRPSQIRATGEFIEELKASARPEDLYWLEGQVTSATRPTLGELGLCPQYYWFKDTPRSRKILGIHGEAK
jgi:hypothetical protein